MKKIFSVLILFTMLFSCAYADEDFLSLQDEASIISPAVEKYILTQNKLLSEETGARIIVATVKSTGELSTTEYAGELYDDLGIAAIGRKNCVFLLLNETGKDYHVMVSDGIAAALTEPYAQKCLVECMESDFEKGNYDEAIVKTYNAFGEWYSEKYRVNLNLTEDMKDYKDIIRTEKKERELKITLIVVLAASVIIITVWGISYLRKRNRMEKLRKKRQERRKRYMQIKTY